MFSIPKKRTLNQERKSEFSKKFQKSTDFQPEQKFKERFARNSQHTTTNWVLSAKELKGFRKSHYEQHNRKNETAFQQRQTTFERKSLNRPNKNQQHLTFHYFIKSEGNNSDRICDILNSRGNWVKCLSKINQNQINFYWNQSNKSSSNSRFQLSLFGRISGSFELTDKARLYENIVNFCQRNQISNQLFLPVTFCFTSRQLQSQIQNYVSQFLEYFQYIQNRTSLTNSWIVKPTNLNRGRDIFLFNSLEKLCNLLFVGNPSFSSDKKILSNIKFGLKNSAQIIKKYKSTHELQPKSIQKPSLKTVDTNSSKVIKNKYNFQRIQSGIQIKKIYPQFQIASDQYINDGRISFNKSKNTIQNVKKTNTFIRLREKSLKLKTQVFLNSRIRQADHLKNSNCQIHQSKEISLNLKSNHKISKPQASQIQEKLLKTILNLVQGRSLYGQKPLKREIVIQKYIENPFLINGNKFDIRIWVLVDQESNFYIFKSGYLRFSSQKYKLDQRSIENNFIHLTNHAVQKHSDKYEKSTSIVKMSYLLEYLRSNSAKGMTQGNSEAKYNQILSQIQRIITISLQATLGNFSRQEHNKQKFNFHTEFELFGYDFLLDRELNVRLIEANCNPSITEDNQYLQQAVPRMLDDLLKLTVDKIFLPKSSSRPSFNMDGFPIQNMWRRIGRIGETNVKDIQKSCQ